MKTLTLVSTGLLLFAIQCKSPKSVEGKTPEQVAFASIKSQLNQGAFLVDVRTPEEFAAGSVMGAVNIPLLEIEKRIKEFEGKPSVIVFCRSGHRAGIAKTTLENYGIKKVTNGINAENVESEMKK